MAFGSPLKTLVEFFAECSGFATTPESMANHLAHLQIDLTDPEFHAVLPAQSVTMFEGTKKLLDDAIALQELKPCDTAALAKLTQEVNHGSMLDCAVYHKGPLAAWIRRSLENLLRPIGLRASVRAREKEAKESINRRMTSKPTNHPEHGILTPDRLD